MQCTKETQLLGLVLIEDKALINLFLLGFYFCIFLYIVFSPSAVSNNSLLKESWIKMKEKLF